MKKLVSLLAMAVVAAAVGCGGAEADPENQQNPDKKTPVIGASHQSECLSNQGQTKDAVQTSSLEALPAAGQLTVVDHNAIFNCCLESEMRATIDGNELTVVAVEIQDPEGACDCECPYELSISISNLEAGSYSLKVYREVVDPATLLYAGTVAVP